MILPSIIEGFPVTLVESQAVGIPALISNSISKEVDLGVGLVNFKSLDTSLEEWCDDIYKIHSKTRIGEGKRLEILKDKGFDIYSSSKRLEAIYSGK